MSFPVTRPDRRILARRRCAEQCVIEYGQGKAAPGVLRQLDLHVARVRLLQRGDEVFGATAWRIGDVLGVRRHSRSAARIRALRAN